MEMLKSYTWLLDILEAVRKGEKLPVDEINLVGGRLSGKSIAVEMFYIISLSIVGSKIGMYAIRHMIKDVAETWDEMIQVMDDLEVEPDYFSNQRKIVRKGSNQLRVIGLNSTTKKKAVKAGITNAGNVDYLFKFFEERYEFEERDTLAAKEGIRSKNPLCQNLDINVCNPWTKSHDYILYCNKHMLWNLNDLRTKGEQFKYIEIPLGNGRVKRVIFQYTNWRVAQTVLPEGAIKTILDTHNFDPQRALTTDYGLPGYEDGSIYNHLLVKIGSSMYLDHINIRGGLDWGWGHNKHSSKTGAVFLGITTDRDLESCGLDIYDTYTSDNRVVSKPNNVVFNEIIEFFLSNTQKYCNAIRNYEGISLTVRVDYQNEAVIQSLNSIIRARRINWMRFIPCRKDVPIQDRIEIFRSMLSQQFVRCNRERTKNLIGELEFARFSDIETAKRVKENDDLINALEYAIEPDMAKYVKINHNTLDEKLFKRKY